MRKISGFQLPALSALLFFSLIFAVAQQPAADSNITIDVVVTPKNGAPVAELRQENFMLLDNQAPASISSFRELGAGQAPAEAIIVVDAVNAGYQTVAFAKGQIATYLKANGGHLALPTALAVITDTSSQVQQGFTQDGNALNSDLEKYTTGLRSIPRSTGFYGADERFQISLKALQSLAASEAGRPGRKLILWVSPGWPLLTGPRIEVNAKQQQALFQEIAALSTQLRQARVTLYAIDPIGVSENLGRVDYYQAYIKGVSKPSQANAANLSLQVLAVQSGGLALNSSDVNGMLQKCIADTTAYYELTFAPVRGEKPETYHHLQVKLTQSDLTARTRDGYYLQP
jgi:VWFA-related protein